MFKVGIVGIGGYANQLVKHISALKPEGWTLSSAVVRSPEKYATQISEVKELFPDCRIVDSLETLLNGEQPLELVILPTGIQYHAKMSAKCLEAGIPVLVEKPVAATIQDVDYMIEVAKRTKLPLSVGFQDLYSPSIRRIKSLIINGSLGKALKGRGVVRWPRGVAYFKRNDWAGKLKSGDEWVLDSVLNNATAHFFNILVNLMGKDEESAATPRSVEWECYRAYDIETYDTVALRVRLQEGGELHYFTSHAGETNQNPLLEVEYEAATVTWTYDNAGQTKIAWKDGRIEEFNNGEEHVVLPMLRSVRERHSKGLAGWATPQNGRPHTLLVNALSEARDQVNVLDSSQYDQVGEGQGFRRIKGLDAYMDKAFAEDALFSELKAPWAKAPLSLDLKGYGHFPRE